MQTSRSKYITLESISLTELFKQEVGAIGLYIPAKGEDGSYRKSIARILASAKTVAAKANLRCLTQTLLVIKNQDGDDLPSIEKVVQVTVRKHDDISPSGARYLKAKAARSGADNE
ncbi:hypothetical protein EZI54_06935 [Marinobacter halodurans]|uniref:Uncharacterized protein n=1 Tax=Marinobacter halodurans TaxID=2528979 RepID=A0ABY1ZQW8_9GAMM|nr:hypothetical protein [Marinobacter halodurans]TBW57386.1 hypothetical protein EZI54_06935 [Marinobacter halodurans]